MHYLAFDVSKDKLDVVLTNLRASTCYFQINNNSKDINEWLSTAKLPKKIVSGSESTANYHLAIQKIMVEKSYVFKLLNPILTKQFIKTTIRKRKTDKNDSLIIAKLLAQGEGRKIGENDLDIAPKIEQRIMGKLITEKHRFSMMSKNLNLYYTIAPFVAKTIHGLEDYLSKEVKTYQKTLEEQYEGNPIMKLLMSITGIGFKTGLIIFSEIGDIKKFNSPKELIAYAGLDPKIRKSGHSINSTGKITKRGSPRLRYAFYMASNVARMHDPELKAYYEKKKQEGKKHTVANLATSRKLANRVFAVWSRQTPYVVKEISKN